MKDLQPDILSKQLKVGQVELAQMEQDQLRKRDQLASELDSLLSQVRNIISRLAVGLD